MWVFFKDLLLVSVGMGIGVVLMCILQVGKDADNVMNELKENAQFKKIVAFSNLIQRIYHNDIRNMLP